MWTPPTDAEKNNWERGLQVETDNGWQEADASTTIKAGSRVSFWARFVGTFEYDQRDWHVIIVDEADFSPENTNVVAEVGLAQLVPQSPPGEMNWVLEFNLPDSAAQVPDALVRIGMVNDAQRSLKRQNPRKAESPIGIATDIAYSVAP